MPIQPPTSLQTLREREDALARQASVGEQLRELGRQRDELSMLLHRRVPQLAEQLEVLRQHCEALDAPGLFPAILDDQVPLPQLRQIRQAINDAHMELLKSQAAEPVAAAEARHGGATVDVLNSLSFAQLTRLGLALSWPLLLALLTAAAMLSAGLFMLF